MKLHFLRASLAAKAVTRSGLVCVPQVASATYFWDQKSHHFCPCRMVSELPRRHSTVRDRRGQGFALPGKGQWETGFRSEGELRGPAGPSRSPLQSDSRPLPLSGGHRYWPGATGHARFSRTMRHVLSLQRDSAEPQHELGRLSPQEAAQGQAGLHAAWAGSRAARRGLPLPADRLCHRRQRRRTPGVRGRNELGNILFPRVSVHGEAAHRDTQNLESMFYFVSMGN